MIQTPKRYRTFLTSPYLTVSTCQPSQGEGKKKKLRRTFPPSVTITCRLFSSHFCSRTSFRPSPHSPRPTSLLPGPPNSSPLHLTQLFHKSSSHPPHISLFLSHNTPSTSLLPNSLPRSHFSSSTPPTTNPIHHPLHPPPTSPRVTIHITSQLQPTNPLQTQQFVLRYQVTDGLSRVELRATINFPPISHICGYAPSVVATQPRAIPARQSPGKKYPGNY